MALGRISPGRETPSFGHPDGPLIDASPQSTWALTLNAEPSAARSDQNPPLACDGNSQRGRGSSWFRDHGQMSGGC